jgi:hypothetical protein
MTVFQFRAPATVLAMLLGTTAAQAQVTAQDVWASWQSQFGLYGEGGVTVGAEDLVDGVLTVTDLSFAQTDETGGAVSMTIPEIVFEELGDGTVGITMSESYPLEMSFPDAATAEMVALTMTVTQSDMAMLASGTPDAINYDVGAARMAVAVTLPNDGEASGDILIGLNDVAGAYQTGSADDLMDITYGISAASMDLLVNVTDTSGVALNLTGKSEGIEMAMSGVVPVAADLAPEMMFPAGLAIAGSYLIGASSYDLSFTENGMTTDAALTMAGGSFELAMDASSFGFANSTEGLSVQISSPMMPFPVDLSLETYGLFLDMPMAPSEAPAPYAVGVNLSGLAVNEEVWSMFDPGQILPRDPATFIVALSGTATMLVDLFDPVAQQEMAMTGAPPGLLNTVSLDELNVAFGGAQITGTGAVTLDNNDLTTIPGMPRPEGSVDLSINGANALIDNLVAMGLIPEDQVMMGRMMLGMFTVPVGDDMLTSKIEFAPDGGILANGQRIQ